jgi:predicted phage-related endonuclease
MSTIHNLIQGSDAWHEFRLKHNGASEAAAMLGLSKKVNRVELLRAKHTGIAREFSDFVQERVLDKGHEVEALARPIVETMVGVEFYPATYSDGRLSASVDGIDLLGEVVFEHKQWSEYLHEWVGGQGIVPEEHMPQCQQILMVTGAKRVLFVVSDGTRENMVSAEVLPDPAWFERIRAGWAQFEKDLAAYVLPQAAEPAPVGKAPETLPALRIEVTGQVTASNLAEFKQTALVAIRSVNRELSTDQDFADAEKAVKWCAEVESRLAAAKEHALSQTADIDALFKTIDDIGAEACRVRLDLDKLVTRRKVEVKEAEVAHARDALALHLEAVNTEISPAVLRHPVQFGDAIKGLKTIDSVRAKLDTALASAKIEVDGKARAIRANLATFREQAAGFEFLFADLAVLLHKAADDFTAAVQARIAQHQAAEAEKVRKAQEAEAQRLAAEAARAAAVAAPVSPIAAAGVAPQAPAVSPIAPVVSSAAQLVPPSAPRADEPATLKLGDINARLAPVKVDAAGLAQLGINPAKVEGSARLYRPQDFRLLCIAIKQHVEKAYVAHLNAREAA